METSVQSTDLEESHLGRIEQVKVWLVDSYVKGITTDTTVPRWSRWSEDEGRQGACEQKCAPPRVYRAVVA